MIIELGKVIGLESKASRASQKVQPFCRSLIKKKMLVRSWALLIESFRLYLPLLPPVSLSLVAGVSVRGILFGVGPRAN
jgi:hypothetical protein